MKWMIPAKTFLVGEYIAVHQGPAIILTTTPCFEVSLVDGHSPQIIHPDSPAGKWWTNHGTLDKTLFWQDPYGGTGGLGASSAQFLGAYLASCQLLQKKPSYSELLEAYYQSSWDGEGLRPSGYDVLAQSQRQCVYINQSQGILQSFDWDFADIGFILVHTGKKLPTHSHLKEVKLPTSLEEFTTIAELARVAFEQKSSAKLIAAVDAYQERLAANGLVAPHSMEFVNILRLKEHVLSVKGCGAMGSDILLLIVEKAFMAVVSQNLVTENWIVMANSDNMHTGAKLL
jgi:mevalonate kinase